MKILLTQDVFKLGQAGEVKEVANGYGRNYLLPQGLAILATPGALKRAEALKTQSVRKRAAEQSEVDSLSKVISGAALFFTARAGEKGKLFGSVTSAMIAEKLTAHIGSSTPFDKRKVMLREPIREIGAHQVLIRLASDVTPAVTVVVAGEGQQAQVPAAATPAAEEAAPEAPAAPQA